MDKHIQEMKTALTDFNALAKAGAAQMEQNAQRFMPAYLEEVNAPVRAAMQVAADAARAKIAAAHAAALASVDAWAQMDGLKIANNTLSLLTGDFPITAADFRRMIRDFESNFTMLTAVAAAAEKRGLLFQCGYIPAPEDKRAVYGQFNASALSLLDTIYTNGGVSDNLLAAYADPTHLTDPRIVAVLEGVAATQTAFEPVAAPDTGAGFGFKFHSAAPNATRW